MQAYIYQADLHCESCALAIMRPLTGRVLGADYRDSQRYPQGPYPDGGGEADTPQHCGTCQTFLENPLTDDGQTYTRDAIYAATGDADVLAQWRSFYDYLDIPDQAHKPCQAPADGSPCDECAQADKRYCPRHLAQIQKLADAGRLP